MALPPAAHQPPMGGSTTSVPAAEPKEVRIDRSNRSRRFNDMSNTYCGLNRLFREGRSQRRCAYRGSSRLVEQTTPFRCRKP